MVFSAWLLAVYGEAFRRHVLGFLLLWIFLPLVAPWLKAESGGRMSVSRLAQMRLLLTSVLAIMSLLNFIQYDDIRDTLGHRWVEGYTAYYYEDADDYEGWPIKVSHVETAHWYSAVGMWTFGLTFFLSLFLLPCMTWVWASEAIRRSQQKESYIQGLRRFVFTCGAEEGERLHQILLGAKDSLLGVSDMDAVVRKDLLRAYQQVELHLFGEVVLLEGEKNLLE